ncbi:MAG: GTP-binding protein [Clostridia bacterium]|nr:GTP-binding protein [Clostridia bacterium]
MLKIDIISGFLGAGKTTLIKKLLSSALKGQKIVLIENEFGDIGIDGGFLKESGIQINEMNSGCICCSLVGDFKKALNQVYEQYAPDRIIIEPSGVGKLSDVLQAVLSAQLPDSEISSLTAVVDAKKCKMYIKNFGEFYKNQIEQAKCVVLSHTSNIDDAKLQYCLDTVKSLNKDAVIVTTPWDEIDGEKIFAAMTNVSSLANDLQHLHEEEVCPVCGGHHHHHGEDEECGCGHHHHHHEDEECSCGHHHHHDEDEECGCGHHHHHGHDADEVFSSWGVETAGKYGAEQIKELLSSLDSGEYGVILRAKGIVPSADGKWIHFDYVPEEVDVRFGSSEVIGRICVIGSKIDEGKLAKLFEIKA